jgi:hypothetical protein
MKRRRCAESLGGAARHSSYGRWRFRSDSRRYMRGRTEWSYPNYLDKERRRVALAMFYARSNNSQGRRRDVASVASVSPHLGILRARTMNRLGADPTKLKG